VLEQVERDVRLLREHGLTLRYTLETHVHADHITGALAIKQATGAQTVVAQDCNAEGYDRYLVDGNVILFGQEEIVVIATLAIRPAAFRTCGATAYLPATRC
jgi:glyoxylase-like metal-dependent hydrolase (beta-lactamase superfamily II)